MNYFLKFFQIIFLTNQLELTYNPQKTVIIQESSKQTIFMEQQEKIKASIGIRIPVFHNSEKFNALTVDCNFTVDTTDTLKANTMIKNIIKSGLGLEDNF